MIKLNNNMYDLTIEKIFYKERERVSFELKKEYAHVRSSFIDEVC